MKLISLFGHPFHIFTLERKISRELLKGLDTCAAVTTAIIQR